MPTFSYKAKDRSGNNVAGTVEATSESHAAATVREMGHFPMEIKAIGGARVEAQSQVAGSAIERYLIFPLWTGVNIKALALFYRQMSTLLASGMTLSEGLRSASRRTRGRLGVVIQETITKVENGGRMSDVLARYPHVFGALQVSLVRVGENSGMLDQMMDRIASYLEYEIKVRQMIAKMMFYPIIVLVMALVISVSLPHVELAVKQGFGPFMQAVWPGLRTALIWVGATVVVLKLFFQFNGVKLVWDFVKIQPPIIGTCARKIAMSRFSRAMALMYAVGIPIAETVTVAADACGNLAIARGIKFGVPALQQGEGLTETLAKTGAIMPMVLDMLATGEKTGNTDAVLQKVADYMDDEADSTIHKIGIVLFVLMILIAAVVVAAIAIQFYSNAAESMLKSGEQAN